MLTRDAMICVLKVMPFKMFLKMRLVSKEWNNAAMNCFWQWNDLLKKKGPKKIGPNSIHKNTRYCDMCKNKQHYTNLDPVYTEGGYQLCMELFSEKYLNKGKSISRRMMDLEDTLQRIKRCEAVLEIEFSQRLEVVKSDKRKQEQKLRRATEEHERFLKNKKTKSE